MVGVGVNPITGVWLRDLCFMGPGVVITAAHIPARDGPHTESIDL